MRDVLKLTLTPDQEKISRLAILPPNKVNVRASHAVGKTFWLGAMTSWFFDSFPTDSCVITTAPTSRDVKDLLWAEIRRQRRRVGLGGFVGESAPEMRDGDDHFAKGFTAAKGESFQGRHYRHMMFAFDESIAIAPIFWDTTRSMFRAGGEHIWLAICNPTDTSSQAYHEEQSVDLDGRPSWHNVSMSAMGHPNIVAELAGRPPPFPAAVTLPQLNTWIADWCERVTPESKDKAFGDFEWPPGAGRWYRPGPMFEARATGHWPKQGVTSVWSDMAWSAATVAREWAPTTAELPVIGVDLASEGDDFTAIHVRWGARSWSHESHNGWLEERTAGRLKQLCATMAAEYNKLLPANRQGVTPEKIPVLYDASGRGGALVNFKDKYDFRAVHAQGPARCTDYYNRRTELWFASAKRALNGCLDLSALAKRSPKELAKIRQEFLAVRWKVVGTGQCRVEDKDDTKKRIKRSPDDADAVNLAYHDSPGWEPPASLAVEKRPLTPEGRQPANDLRDGLSKGRRLFGMNGGL